MKNKFVIGFMMISLSLVYGQEKMTFEFDFAQFGYDSTANYIEFYYSFNKEVLTQVETDSGKYVSAQISVEVENSETNETVIYKRYGFRREIVDSTISAGSNTLIGTLGFVIPAGKYDLRFGGIDALDSNRSKYYTESFTCHPLYNGRVSISDLQLASSIKSENTNRKSIFYKNTLEVYPNPAIIYTNASPVVYYYSEIYNLLTDSTSSKYILNRVLFNSRGNAVYQKQKPLNRQKNSIVEVGLINLKKFATDTYTLVIGLTDSIRGEGVISSKKFFLYNPGVTDSTAQAIVYSDYLGSEFGVLTEEECDRQFEIAIYIASSEEIDQYENLNTLDSKREFLFNFWNRRDEIASTPENEFRAEYLDRYNYVNQRYRAFKKEGWKTDRGRVFMVYGEPDQIDMHPNETDKNPYEIWSYHSIEGGVIFIFGDLTGFSDYELLHSTKRGEIRDESWIRRLMKN